MNKFLENLKERDLVVATTDLDELSKSLDEGIVLYCGFDPTADSLHVGSLLPLITMFRFVLNGHKAIPLIGGATGLIGDPSFKSAERKLNDVDTVNQFKKAISKQIESMIHQKPLDNLDWAKEISIIDFLRDFGKHFTVNKMMSKDSVKERLNRDGDGISFTEFTYSIMQAMDFAHLFKNHNCTLQIGGSDQWGNMTAGTELIRKSFGHESKVHILTMPLVTKSDGTKFGKTESGTIWLDPNKTSPFEFFQFWLNISDKDSIKFLKMFTMLSLEEINEIEQKDKENHGKPEAQSILAFELTKFVHGEETAKNIQRITKTLFSETENFSLLTEKDFNFIIENKILPFIEKEEVVLLEDMLVKSGLAKSKREAREFSNNGAITAFNEKITNPKISVNDINDMFGFVILKRGKNKLCIFKK